MSEFTSSVKTFLDACSCSCISGEASEITVLHWVRGAWMLKYQTRIILLFLERNAYSFARGWLWGLPYHHLHERFPKGLNTDFFPGRNNGNVHLHTEVWCWDKLTFPWHGTKWLPALGKETGHRRIGCLLKLLFPSTTFWLTQRFTVFSVHEKPFYLKPGYQHSFPLSFYHGTRWSRIFSLKTWSTFIGQIIIIGRPASISDH